MIDKGMLFKQELDTKWIKGLSNGTSLHELVDTTRVIPKAKKLKRICCCDGRCPRHGEEIFLAGSGILMDISALEMFIKENEIEVITSHFDCGAGRLAYSLLSTEEQAKYLNAEDYVQKWGKEISEKFGLKYEYISETDLTAPEHYEMGIIIDTTYDFHTLLFDGTPNFFITNAARFASEKYITTEVSVLADIGLGPHGFGSFFNSDTPFYILIAARSREEAVKLIHLCEEARLKYQNEITIDLLNF